MDQEVTKATLNVNMFTLEQTLYFVKVNKIDGNTDIVFKQKMTVSELPHVIGDLITDYQNITELLVYGCNKEYLKGMLQRNYTFAKTYSLEDEDENSFNINHLKITLR